MSEQLPLLDKRWNKRVQTFVVPSVTVDRRAYTIAPISTKDAREFTCLHHYSGTFPAARMNVGLLRDGRLVGVATFSHPMNDAVLTKHLGHTDGCELGRFVLLSEEPFNTESFFLARALRILRVEKPSLRGVVSFADPVERRDAGGFVTKPSHWGCIYAASNAKRLGRTSGRWLTIAPNGTILSARALSKIRNGERGHAYVQRQLEQCDLPARAPNEGGRDWLERLMPFCTRQYHPGNIAFSFALR